MSASKKILVTFLAGAAIIMQLLNPMRVFADGETTPPPAETTEATEPPVATDLPKEVIPTETPAATDIPTLEPVITEMPALTTEPIETSTEVAASETLTPLPTEIAEEPTLLEVVQEISPETDIIVLDETGQPLSLGTQEAADAIAAGDPIWCPDGAAPIANTGGCTGSYSTMNDLLANEGTNIDSQSVNGTIWISSGTIGDVNPIVIDGSVYSNWSNYSLTLQGGWGGSTSVFTVPISIVNWNNNVTVNNITIDDLASGGTSGGLYITTWNPEATVDVNNVLVRGARGFGLRIETLGGDVMVQNSTFRDTIPDYSIFYPYGDAAGIFSSGGDVTIKNSEFINNDPYGGEYGAWVSTGETGDLVVQGSTFSGNNVGLAAFSSNNIYIYKDNIFQSNSTGLSYSNCSGNLLIESGVTFAGNYDADIANWGGCAEPIEYVPPVTLSLSTRGAGSKFTLDCTGRDGFSVPLPNGDLVQIFCPVSGEAEIARLDNTILPASLPDGYTYASAFDLRILQSDEKPMIVINDAGYIKASFIASNLNSPGNSYSILYWDSVVEEWVVLKDFMRDGNSSRSFYLDPEDPANPNARRKIISGVKLVSTSKEDRVEVSTNFPGIFVLAQH
jgi:hypothetical protein